MRTFLKILGILALIAALSALSLITYDYLSTRKAFPPRTFIGEIDVSLLTQKEALAKLKKFSTAQLFAPLITLEVESSQYSFSPEKLGLHVLYKETVQKAFALTHQDLYLESLKERMTKEATLAPLVLALQEEQLKAIFEALASEIYVAPKDAAMVFYEKTGGYHIEPEELGKEIDVEKSLEAFKATLSKRERVFPLPIIHPQPRVTEEALRAHPPVSRLSAYTTYYGKHDSPNRIHNIKLIASWIDNTLMIPGDQFSMAEILGEVTEEQGFKEAFVIMSGELVPLLGGGACQVATTIYNAAAIADINVLERRNHSFYFNIYPLGRDAGVYPEQFDFKFENDTPYPILIKARATNQRLSVRIYGTPHDKRANFSSAKVYGRSDSGEFVPMSLDIIIEKDLPFKTEVVRTVYDTKGIRIKKETIRSRYKLYGDKENVPIRNPEPR